MNCLRKTLSVLLGVLCGWALGGLSLQAQTTTTLYPIHDAYLQNGVNNNYEVLRVEAGSRTRDIYLMFDLTGITGTISNLELELTVYSDPGSGTLEVYTSSDDSWTETGITGANAPSITGGMVASRNANYSLGSVHPFDVTSSLSGGYLTLIISHTSNSDIGFASTGPEVASNDSYGWFVQPQSSQPKLNVTYTTGGGGDSTAPSAPTSLSSSSVTSNSAVLNWNHSSDNVGVTHYLIYQGSSLVATIGNTNTYNATGLSASTTYTYTVRARDAAGNVSGDSNQETFTTTTSGGGGTGDSPWSQSGSTVYYNGSVGIGTTATHDSKLAVDGKILSEEIKVELSGAWPDYVFTKEYSLPKLEQVRAYIEKHGHLEDIPAAIEVEENGIELGEMNRLLLEKIEQQMLYILELERRISRLENP